MTQGKRGNERKRENENFNGNQLRAKEKDIRMKEEKQEKLFERHSKTMTNKTNGLQHD